MIKIPKFLFWPIVLTNITGIIYGYFFFYPEIIFSNLAKPWLLPFVADSPTSTLLVLVSIFLVFKGFEKKFNFLYLLGMASALIYGVWSIFVLIFFQNFYVQQGALLYWILVLSHAGLALEALLLLGRVKPKLWHLFAVAGIHLLNNYLDFFHNLHAPLPENSLQWVFWFSAGLSIIISAVCYFALISVKEPIAEFA
ncbi:MAG: DUF1405 domain-containing protein [Candidatus Diapherotrites archaeon]|nr:DUF1405 domain-containing protein [Candidatus Diapherotrites archaeon]